MTNFFDLSFSLASLIVGGLMLAFIFFWNRKAIAEFNLLNEINFSRATACYNLGNYKKAVEIYERLARKGHSVSQYNLAVLYETGIGTLQDEAAAMRLFLESAQQGNLRSQYTVGFKYYHGFGVITDNAKARTWLRIAARNGYGGASAMIDLIREAEQDSEAAKNLLDIDFQQHLFQTVAMLENAALKGDVDAQSSLASCYLLGKGVERDNILA